MGSKRKVITIILTGFGGRVKEVYNVGSLRKMDAKINTYEHSQTWEQMVLHKAELRKGNLVRIDLPAEQGLILKVNSI